MYSIKVLTDGMVYPLFLSGVEELALLEPVLVFEIGMQGSLTFRLPRGHPCYDKIIPLASEFYVYQDGEEIFRGRYAGREEDFYRTGKVTCEGDLAYLLDSIQRPYVHQGSIEQFLAGRLAEHNSQVEARKRYELGRVTVADSNNYINRSATGYANTLDCLREKLVKTHGGYLRTRQEAGKRYLDYVTDYGGSNSQVIRFGENLLDLTQYIDATSIVTALIPTGADAEITLPDGTTGTKKVDITSVNDGRDYIYDQTAVKQYGWIWGTQEWPDVTLPENLIRKARAYLQENVTLPQTLQLTAVDLSLADADIQAFKIGYWTQIRSDPHGAVGTYLLTAKTMHLDAPEQDTITLGGKLASFTASAAKKLQDMSLRVQQTAESASREINRKVENATNLITGGLGGYIVIGLSEADHHPEELLIMDAPTKEAAKNVIRLNQHGLGFSTSGYNGVYRNAWTIDGNLVADFVTTGSMLADRIRGGTLEVGGQGLGQNGTIAVYDKAGALIGRIDIDGLYAIAGQIAGWSINTDTLAGKNLILDGAQGLIRSILEGDVRTWTSLNDGSVKSWVDNKEVAYLGRGGYNGRGSKDGGLIFAGNTGGGESVELDGATGRLNATGGLYTGGRMRCKGADVEGSMSVSGRAYFTGAGVEVSGDISCGGRIDASNISEIWGEIQAIKNKIGM